VNVFVAGVAALLVDVDHRAVDVEVRDHLGLARRLVDDQRVDLSRWLVDERAFARDPVVLEVAPRALDHVAGHPRRVDVPRQHAALAHPQQVAPAAGDRVEQQRAEPDVGRLRNPHAFVVGNRWDGDLPLDAGVLSDHE